MPVRYEILPHRAVHVRMTGAINPGEVVDFLHNLARDPALEPAMPHFGDMRGVTQPATGADLERIASALEQMRPHFVGVRCAVVVASPLVFGTVRQFGAMVERAGMDVTPFVDERAAWAWLGVEPPG